MKIRTVLFPEGPLFCKVIPDPDGDTFLFAEKYDPSWQDNDELSRQMLDACFLTPLVSEQAPVGPGSRLVIQVPKDLNDPTI